MGTFLFASQPAMGHLNPMFAIARQLELRGHRAVFACPAIEAPRSSVPETGYFIGPCFAGREGQGDPSFPFDRFAAGKPKVYVSLGTVFNRRPQVFRRILDAHADGRCQLIVSAGGAYEALRAGGVPGHVLLFPRVPQVEVLDRVDAVVSHGGNNTVNETLAAGRPLLVMPVGGEQGDNACRVEHLGAGLRADLKRSPAEEIGAKVRRLLEEPSFARRARECADALAKTDGPGTAARFIERVASTRCALVRPAGHPLTVLRGAALPW
ncbi:MAG: nucleotide disphospho-sugar-binding domain-containing protein [Planctomycetota bacterium]